jgi:hypothetical protein
MYLIGLDWKRKINETSNLGVLSFEFANKNMPECRLFLMSAVKFCEGFVQTINV